MGLFKMYHPSGRECTVDTEYDQHKIMEKSGWSLKPFDKKEKEEKIDKTEKTDKKEKKEKKEKKITLST